jgi:hypothetical protein
MLLDPRVIEGGVVRHEIEHQAQVPLGEALAQSSEGRIAAEVGMHYVAGDRKSRARDIVLGEVRERRFEFPSPLRIGARRALTGEPGSPHAQQPDPVEPHHGDAIEVGVRDVVQRGGTAERV